jgi:hypothetical protein
MPSTVGVQQKSLSRGAAFHQLVECETGRSMERFHPFLRIPARMLDDRPPTTSKLPFMSSFGAEKLATAVRPHRSLPGRRFGNSGQGWYAQGRRAGRKE